MLKKIEASVITFKLLKEGYIISNKRKKREATLLIVIIKNNHERKKVHYETFNDDIR